MSDQPISTRNELAQFNHHDEFHTTYSHPADERKFDPDDGRDSDGGLMVVFAIVVFVCVIAFLLAFRP